jgi:hypothetical protein
MMLCSCSRITRTEQRQRWHSTPYVYREVSGSSMLWFRSPMYIVDHLASLHAHCWPRVVTTVGSTLFLWPRVSPLLWRIQVKWVTLPAWRCCCRCRPWPWESQLLWQLDAGWLNMLLFIFILQLVYVACRSGFLFCFPVWYEPVERLYV